MLQSTNMNETERLGAMLQQYLQYRALTAPPVTAGRHLDEDALSVFVEGSLSEREAAPLMNHLVACASCRHTTAQLIRLDVALEPELKPFKTTEPAPEPSVFRRFFDSLRARVLHLGSESEVVFAYHETDNPVPETPADDEKTA